MVLSLFAFADRIVLHLGFLKSAVELIDGRVLTDAGIAEFVHQYENSGCRLALITGKLGR